MGKRITFSKSSAEATGHLHVQTVKSDPYGGMLSKAPKIANPILWNLKMLLYV
jgi:hypothetical protein